MNFKYNRHQKNAKRTTLSCLATICLVLGAYPLSALAKDVNVAQMPLTSTQSVEPNIMFVLDDSTSMWDEYMPDEVGKLLDASNYSTVSVDGVTYTGQAKDMMINPLINGIYYDPKVTYLPPPKADGSLYPSFDDMSAVPNNGFHSLGEIIKIPVKFRLSTGETTEYVNYKVENINLFNENVDHYRDYGKGNARKIYTHRRLGWGLSAKNLFAYAQGPQSKLHYIAPTVNQCSGVSDCTSAEDTSGTAAPKGVRVGTNVANWFAYYHQRILTAQSGVMNAFSSLDDQFRVGYGTIHARQGERNYTDKVIPEQHEISRVKTFDVNRKDSFWEWLTKADIGGNTPLRQGMQTIGGYYQTAHPWLSKDKNNKDVELACRQSYLIMTSDGYWTDRIGDGNLSEFGNVDGSNKFDENGQLGKNGNNSLPKPFADNHKNTLADIAMKYWATDLRPNLDNKVVPNPDDPAFWQHMVTFTVGLGIAPKYLLEKGTNFSEVKAWARDSDKGISNGASFSWPKPGDENPYNVDDMAHAAINGHGDFFSASNPQELENSLVQALSTIVARVGSGASLGTNDAFTAATDNAQTATSGGKVYQASYQSGTWTGDVKALRVKSNGDIDNSSPVWAASAALPDWDKRQIYTSENDTQLKAFKADTNASAGKTFGLDAEVINYLRGDTSHEQRHGGDLRNRKSSLGDIISSMPVFVGHVNKAEFAGKSFIGADQFTAFAESEANRKGQVYVAANDGMLHAFNDATGEETFAYLPRAVIQQGAGDQGIEWLTDPAYGGDQHVYFNDGELTVQDVYLNGAWKTVLVGTAGRGLAQVVYALDITNPQDIDLLWEKTSNALGQTTGKPLVAQTADGEWSVLLGNGYNSGTGGALLQFDLVDGTLTTHAAGTSGLAQPQIYAGGDNKSIATAAYATDLDGKLWRFDLTTNALAQQVFAATDNDGNAQPITAGILLKKDPNNNNLWAFFGTGKYLSADDIDGDNSKQTQTWYGVLVEDAEGGLKTNVTRPNLAQRGIKAEAVVDNTRVRVFDKIGEVESAENGWYIDLVSPGKDHTGERMIAANQWQDGVLVGTSRIPNGADPCDVNGTGWVMTLDPFTGTNPVQPFFDFGNGGFIQIGEGDDKQSYPIAGIGYDAMPNAPTFIKDAEGRTHMAVSLEDASVKQQKLFKAATFRRTSWREIR